MTTKLLSIKVSNKFWYFIQPYAYKYHNSFEAIQRDIELNSKHILFKSDEVITCEYDSMSYLSVIQDDRDFVQTTMAVIKNILGDTFLTDDCLPEFDIRNTVYGKAFTYDPVKMKPHKVKVRKPEEGTICTNELEASFYRTTKHKPYILTGAFGAEWVTDFDKLTKTYEHEDGSKITKESLQNLGEDAITIISKEDSPIVFAALLREDKVNVPVTTVWDDILYANRDGIEHDDGDYIICNNKCGEPDFNDMWVVNGVVFSDTYKYVL